mgnify:CR=1 FL=1
MKKNFRLISRLDIKNDFLVKGIQMEGWKKVGCPNNFAERYYENGVDELLVMDIVASLYRKKVNENFLNFLKDKIYIPITFGGGIRSVEDATKILSKGADKICINTAAVHNPNLIDEIAKKFGTQAISVAIDISLSQSGEYFIATEFGRNLHDKDINEWIEEIQERGAGEIIITSIQRDGTLIGFDIDFFEKLYKNIYVPFIIGGGFGEINQLSDLFNFKYIDGVLVGTAFHQNELSVKDCKNFIFENGYETRKI